MASRLTIGPSFMYNALKHYYYYLFCRCYELRTNSNILLTIQSVSSGWWSRNKSTLMAVILNVKKKY